MYGQLHLFPLRLIGSLLVGLGFLYPFSVRAGTASFDPADGILIVRVIVNGHIEARFGLDSGADDLYIDSSFAVENDILPSVEGRPFSVKGIGTQVIAHPVSLRSITVADEGIYNLSGAIVDLAGISGLEHGQQPDGLIGFQALNDFVMTIDYAKDEVSLSQSWPDAVTDDPIEIEFVQKDHWIALEEAKTESWFLLDLCSSHSLITQDAVADMQLIFHNDQVRVNELVLSNDWTLGPIFMSLMPTQTLSALRPKTKIGGLLGQQALAGLRLTIDYDRRVIRIEKP